MGLREFIEGKNRCVILLRASSSGQMGKMAEDELPAQRKLVRKFADENNLIIVREVTEGAVSAYKNTADERSKIRFIKDMAIRREFDVLLVFHSNRLGRIGHDTPALIDWFYKEGVRVFSTSECCELSSNTPMDIYHNQVRSFQSENDSYTKSKVISAYHMNMVENGTFRGGSMIPLGYKLEDNGSKNFKNRHILDFVICPEEAEIVKKIYDLSIRMNYGQSRIAQQLNKEGYVTKKGGGWHSSTIQVILNNVMYKGMFKFKSKQLERTGYSNVVDELVIIPEEMWELNQIAMKNRMYEKQGYKVRDKRTSKNTYGKLLLNGLVFCGNCGMSLTTMTAYNVWNTKDGVKHKTPYYKYRCSSFYKRGSIECIGKGSHSKNKIEPKVISDIKNCVVNMQGKTLTNIFIESLEMNIIMLQMKKKETADKLDRAYKKKKGFAEEYGDAIIDKNKAKQKFIEDINEANESEILGFNSMLETIDKEIVLARAEKIDYASLAGELDGWAERFDACDMVTQRSMLSQIIDRIIVIDDVVKINYSGKVQTFLANSTRSVVGHFINKH